MQLLSRRLLPVSSSLIQYLPIFAIFSRPYFSDGLLGTADWSGDSRLSLVCFLEASAVRFSRLLYLSEEGGLLISYSPHDQKRSKRSHEVAFASL